MLRLFPSQRLLRNPDAGQGAYFRDFGTTLTYRCRIDVVSTNIEISKPLGIAEADDVDHCGCHEKLRNVDGLISLRPDMSAVTALEF